MATQPMATAPLASPAPDPAARVRDLAYRVIGTDRGRDFWMSQPNPELGGRSPQDLIDDGQPDVVVRYLEAALAGDFG